MHPDAILAGLRKELERFPERADEINEQIEYGQGLPKPESTPEQSDTIIDHRPRYLRGLERELERSGEHRRAEVQAEIDRVKKQLRDEPTLKVEPEGEPSEDDDLSELTVKQLHEIASKRGIELPRGAKKPEILEALAQDQKVEPEGEPSEDDAENDDTEPAGEEDHADS